MRPLLITACAFAALASACDGDSSVRITRSTDDRDDAGVLRVIQTLQCPDTLGALTRRGSAQAGGKVCTYGGPRGAEVSLHLVSLETDTADAVLEAFETRLRADMPATGARMRGDGASSAVAVASGGGETASVQPPGMSVDGDRADVRMPGLDVEANADRATVRMPGISIDADGDNARVRVGGMIIDADETSSNVAIASNDESVSVQARDDAAEIRTRGSGPSTRMTYVLTDKIPSETGWRLVGYEARGPRGGPIVVATVRARDRDDGGVFDAAKDLITLNVGR